MSVRAMSWVWDHYDPGTRGASKKLLLLAIADSCNDFGECYPGVTRLAEKINLTERSTQMLLNKLVEDGELSIAYNDGIATQHGKTNRYFLARYRASLNLTDEAEFTPKSDGVKPSSPQEVKPTSSQGVKPSSPKPSEEPSEEPSADAHARVSADDGLFDNVPLLPAPDKVQLDKRIMELMQSVVSGTDELDKIRARYDDFTVGQWVDAIQRTIDRRNAGNKINSIAAYAIGILDSEQAEAINSQPANVVPYHKPAQVDDAPEMTDAERDAFIAEMRKARAEIQEKSA